MSRARLGNVGVLLMALGIATQAEALASIPKERDDSRITPQQAVKSLRPLSTEEIEVLQTLEDLRARLAVRPDDPGLRGWRAWLYYLGMDYDSAIADIWKVREEGDFEFVNSHEKVAAVRDSSKRATLERSLITRLRNSKNMILIVGEATRYDTDWVPFEIKYAVDECKIPIIAAYVDCERIMDPAKLRGLWPKALADRIDDGTARVIHIPFKQDPLKDAASQFDFDNPPKGTLVYYSKEAYMSWGLS